ncbi:hypothetical protein [Sphingobacterium psychroaquaticum]|uniref:Ig-like domain-containing protein n=1 Tax=Sphingobacterium psychroaquaticum TaxID=561061 RepID=A0A1X7IXG1_9SPHI|nr:hypothetical protein [Sphingobacterium psychroaquaticum]SMG19833.1 hypothetical protein SAMN05660862_1174 [Sphingobacterium psychroaquaticum]
MKKLQHILFYAIGLFLLFLSTNAIAQQTMYWVGGTGNWDDLRHWSYQSGSQGAIQPSSIPNANTHVIIDANSGFNGATNKSINTKAAVHIKSLTFKPDLNSNNSPYIYGQNNITVYGNVTLQPYVTLRSEILNIFLQINPSNTEVATLTSNGAVLEMEFAKIGAGKLIVADNFNNQNERFFRTMLQEGHFEYHGDTLKTDVLYIEGQTKVDMPVLTTLLLNSRYLNEGASNYSSFVLKGTPTLSFPQLETIHSNTTNGYLDFRNDAVLNLNLPALKYMRIGGILGNFTGPYTLTVPDNSTIHLTHEGWQFHGVVAPSKFTLNLSHPSKTSGEQTLLNCSNTQTRFHNINIETQGFTAGISAYLLTIDSLNFIKTNGNLLTNTTIGSLSLAPRRTFTISNNSNGSSFYMLYFSGLGDWTLSDDLKTIINGSIYFLGGTLNSNKKDIYIGANFYSIAPYNSPVNAMGKWDLNITDSKISIYQTWEYSTKGALQAARSTLEFRLTGSITSSPNHSYHDVILVPSTYSSPSLSISGGANTSFSDILVYGNDVSIIANINAKSLRLISEKKGATISFRNNVDIGILEVPANGILRMQVNLQLLIRDQLITHTADCSGSMEMYATQANSTIVSPEGTFFKFRALKDIFVPNVIMTGVQADISTGVSYNATGTIVRDVKNWQFIDKEPKDLYWIGAADNQWFNPNNWTTNSDGTPSGGCLPTRTDNVRFNSFSNRYLPIVTEGAIASINNPIADEDCPENLEIQHKSGTSLYIYGDRIEMGRGMFIQSVALNSATSAAIIINRSSAKQTSGVGALNINTPTTTWIFRGNMRIQSNYAQSSAKEVIFDMDTFTGSSWFTIYAGTLNISNLKFAASSFNFYGGNVIASNSKVTLATDFNSANAIKNLNIENSEWNVGHWNYLTGTSLKAEGSRIFCRGNFFGTSGHQYYYVETTAGVLSNDLQIQGDLSFHEIRLNHSRRFTGNVTTGTLFLAPRALTLTLQENTTLTVTEDLSLSETPCNLNIITSRLSSTGSTIKYANPNGHNRFDFVSIGGIQASEAPLLFQVNSGDAGNNNQNVIFLAGTPGLIGLGEDLPCAVINPQVSSSYLLSAEQFFGGNLSQYKWYKKNNKGVFVLLNTAPSAVAIDARAYGLDGEYKVEIIYDATVPANQQCTAEDFITVSYTPELVHLPGGIVDLSFCSTNSPTVSDLRVDQQTLDYITATGATLSWHSSINGQESLNVNTPLETGTYYAALTSLNKCESAERTKVTVTFYEMPVAIAGPSQRKYKQKTFLMAATAAVAGTAYWEVISGEVEMNNTTQHNATVTLTNGGKAALRWVIDNGGCISSDIVYLESYENAPRVNPNIRAR